MKKYLILLLLSFIVQGIQTAHAANTETYQFMNESVLYDIKTAAFQVHDYCKDLKTLGVQVMDGTQNDCLKTYTVLTHYQLNKDILQGVTIQFEGRPFLCNTFNHGMGLYNGCYTWSTKLLQIVTTPIGTKVPFDFLLLHEVARVTGIHPDQDADNWAAQRQQLIDK